MPSIADLNVRLGLIYKDLDKGLESVERKLRASSRRLSDLGDQLTFSVSLPMAAAGAAAVKAAGDIESLQLALESQLGSAEKARRELELLRQAALAPGLGFEQAVRGSVSLQAVGFQADKARKIITEFGNGLALAGKGAQELDGVVLALTQIQSKGVVSAEEISQIAERLPQIRTLMQQAFGTASSEAIQKLGISSQQFIEGITKELEKLPRATGGIKNALENFFQGIQQGAARFGFAISKAVDLPNNLERLSAGLNSLAEGFESLNPTVQKYIVYAGAAFIATGPMLKVFGALKGAGAQVIDVMQGLASGTKAASGYILQGAAAFQKLDLAMKLTVAGGVIAAATALYFAFQNLSTEVSATASVMNQAAAAAQDERSKTEFLVDILNDENATRREKVGALNKLKQISPEYFGQLKIEKDKIDGLVPAYEAYIDSILKAARAKAAEEKLIEIDKKAIANAEKLNRLRASRPDGNLPGATTGLGSFTAVQQQSANTQKELVASAEAEAQAIKNEMDALKELIRVNTDWGKSVETTTPKTKDYGQAMGGTAKATKEAKTELDLYLEKLHQQETLQNKIREAAASMGLAPLDTLPQAGTGVGGAVSSNAPAQGPQLPAVDALVSIPEKLTPVQEAIANLKLSFSDMAASWGKDGESLKAVSDSVGQAVQQMANTGETSLGKYAAAAAAAALKTAKAEAVAGIYSAVSSALETVPFPFGIAAAGLAAGAAAALLNGLTNKIKIPGFAMGTTFAPEGMALVGERGPELVNLPRGAQVKPNNTLDRYLGGNSVNVSGTFRIAGTDLLVVLEKAQNTRGRVAGN